MDSGSQFTTPFLVGGNANRLRQIISVMVKVPLGTGVMVKVPLGTGVWNSLDISKAMLEWA